MNLNSTKSLWLVIICLFLALSVSVLINLDIINPFAFLKHSSDSKQTEKVFQLTNLNLTMNKDWRLPQGISYVRLDLTIENISKEPQLLHPNNLSLFDYTNCRYDISTLYTSTIDPYLFSETINPNTKKEVSVVFEVPQNELYIVVCSDDMELIGKHSFTDKIRNVKCEYVSYQDMIEVRNRLVNKPIIEKKQTGVRVDIPEVQF